MDDENLEPVTPRWPRLAVWAAFGFGLGVLAWNIWGS